jgi:hypothetical protein
MTLNPDKDFTYLFDYLNNVTLEIDVSLNYSSQVKTDEIHVQIDEHKLVLKEEK